MGFKGRTRRSIFGKAKLRSNSITPISIAYESCSKGRRRSIPEDILPDEDEKPVRNCPILQLPLRERILIWKRVENISALRRTCSRIKADIDHFVGLPGILKEAHPSFQFFATVGLQSINVVNLSSVNIEQFLLHPLLLRSLNVTGDISSNYFAYITEYCPYLTSLKIRFSQHTISKRVYFFPILGQHWGTERNFQFLDTVYLESVTRRNDDLTYIQETITELFTTDLCENHSMKKLRISIDHKNSAVWDMKLINQVVSRFTNANACSLTHICIEITDKRPEAAFESSSAFPERLPRKDSPVPNRRDSLAVYGGAGEEKAQNLLLQVSRKPSALTLENWNGFPRLTKLYLAVNGECCDFWKAAFIKTRVLTNLFLELKIIDNWPIYCSFIGPASRTLTQIDCYEITRNHRLKTTAKIKNTHVQIDTSIFKKCKQLHRLSLNFANTEHGVIYSLLNISHFPRQLNHLELSWIILQPCDLAKLALTHRRLLHLDVSYWCLTDEHFYRFWCLFKLIFFFHLTSLVQLSVTESKIRFQDGMNAVYAFIKSQKHFARFLDVEDTCLLFDRKPITGAPQKPF